MKGLASSASTPLEDYLDETRDLIDETNRFCWLTKQIVTDAEVELLANEVGRTEQDNPFCQMRAERWQGKLYEEGKTDPSECFDVHFELKRVRNKNVEFMMHYETNPYVRCVNTREEIPEE